MGRPPRCHHGHSHVQPTKPASHRGAGQDRRPGTVHSGTCGVYGPHKRSIICYLKGPGARGPSAHPVGVRARGSEAALYFWVLNVCVGHLAHGDDIQLLTKHLYCKKIQKERKENAPFYINEKNNLVGFISVNMNKYVPMLTCCHI